METTPEWESITPFRRVEKDDIQQCYRNCRSKSGDFNKNRSVMSVAQEILLAARPTGATALVCYSFVPAFLEVSARQTYRYLSSLDVTTGIFLSRVARFKADRRFCIFSPPRLLSGILTASSWFSFKRSPRMSDTTFRCFPLRPCGTSDRFTAE